MCVHAAPPPPSPLDQWTKRFQEAERLVDEVAKLIAERETALPREVQRRTAEIRRNVTILGTRLDMLKEALSDLPKTQKISMKQLSKLTEKLSGLSDKADEVGGQFTMKNKYSSDSAKIDVNSIADMDNREIVSLQRKIIKEQDYQLEKLGVTVTSTKHIALAINEELDLHTRLIDDLDEGVEETTTQLERAIKRLRILSKRMRKSGSCWGIVLSVVAAVICVAVVLALITISH
ncbi:hypothetical protein U9M48_005911 [Paspalum notatum var. saurae]|uniref:t-SNARE coiled-coil homology domain-containing protein n=1 Tax=Paspalum notatum var. saurae TaxID=547442 RepID=A0AAQ3PR41_PASNO